MTGGRLEEQLNKSKQQPEIKKPTDSTIQTPQQKIADADAELKAFRIQKELDSEKFGYESFKARESSIADRENAFKSGWEQLSKEKATFQTEQTERMKTYNAKVEEFNQKWDLVQTKHEEVDRLMEEALQKKTEADRIIIAQTSAEKIAQEKSEAYKEHLDECFEVFEEIANLLLKRGNASGDSKLLNVGRVITAHLNLMKRMKDRESNSGSIADVMAVSVDRLMEVAEHLQDDAAKLRYDSAKLLDYLMKNLEWVSWALKLAWQPTIRQELVI